MTVNFDAMLECLDSSLRPNFASILRRGDIEAANTLAMALSDVLLTTDPDRGRAVLWSSYFSALHENFLAQYQSQDFEIIDYNMFSLKEGLTLFRGPKPSLQDIATGNYICMIGAAQLFGRFHQRSLQQLLTERYNIPVLNLSIGGAGVQSYLDEPYLTLMKRSKLLLVQVLSGRSVGCDEYPGTWTTVRPGSSAPIPREIVLREIWEENRAEALRLIRKWSGLYVDFYRTLCSSINAPKVLLWISTRAPSGWSEDRAFADADFGAFPQLVSQKEIDQIRSVFDGFVECPPDLDAGFGFKSRLTGLPCPYIWPDGTLRWIDNYYPSQAAHERAVQELAPILDGRLI